MRKSFIYAFIGFAIHLILVVLFIPRWLVDAVGYFVAIGLIGAYLEKLIEEKKSKEDQ